MSPTLALTQLLMSCLHAWDLDPQLDGLCASSLGLLPPRRPMSFGLLSRGGHMSLLLPGWWQQLEERGGDAGDKGAGQFLVLRCLLLDML